MAAPAILRVCVPVSEKPAKKWRSGQSTGDRPCSRCAASSEQHIGPFFGGGAVRQPALPFPIPYNDYFERNFQALEQNGG